MVFLSLILGCKHRRGMDAPRLEKWIRTISRECEKGTQMRPTQYSRMCSDHFTDFDYVPGTKTKTLKTIAVPTQFPTYLRFDNLQLGLALLSVQNPIGLTPAKRSKHNLVMLRLLSSRVICTFLLSLISELHVHN
ncbi:hypothetical protein RRG08_052250 [Elysia crispata]|uniref:THAP-type domain-containing protein n=1 Tax=Elysia crispata TaxID=231223 RepID=A0AAE1AXR6_9GAST|nr:hypothetical protein RRG08_052250 [Elysia crispata]